MQIDKCPCLFLASVGPSAQQTLAHLHHTYRKVKDSPSCSRAWWRRRSRGLRSMLRNGTEELPLQVPRTPMLLVHPREPLSVARAHGWVHPVLQRGAQVLPTCKVSGVFSLPDTDIDLCSLQLNGPLCSCPTPSADLRLSVSLELISDPEQPPPQNSSVLEGAA